MGFFDQFSKKGGASIKTKQVKVKTEHVKTVKPVLHSKASHTSSHSKKPAPPQVRPVVQTSSETNGDRRGVTPAAARKRARPSQEPLFSSSDDDSDNGDDIDITLPAKRLKTEAERVVVDPDRVIRASKRSQKGSVYFIHGSEIANLSNKKYKARFDDLADGSSTLLAYPGCTEPEKFNLVDSGDVDEFRPLDDIIESVKMFGTYYFPRQESKFILDEISGIVRKLEKAKRTGRGSDFTSAVTSFNDKFKSLQDEGLIDQTIDSITRPPLPLVERILNQAYARTVSLKVESLRKYENGTDNVYGELLPKFITTILADSGLTSSQVFVDLGSGVGNVVLQAALEIGCESWGCEMMENACALAEAQEREFHSRCKMWDILPGDTHLERGDFLTNVPTGQALKRADVVLVNNQAFTPALNDALTNLFLDLKEGCKIISLKSFVPHDHVISFRNANSPVNLLEVTEKVYYSGSVSWKDAPGTYYVAIKDSKKLRAFEKSRRP